MKYYVIAGERSGDMHASNLIRALHDLDPDPEFRGIGGELMVEAGVELLMHYNNIALMGFAEVFMKFNKLRKIFKATKGDLLKFKPDVLILVDSAGFNLRIAKFASKNGFTTYYYISPKVWAWNQSRALKIKRLIDRMFVILPFEKEFYKKFDYEVDYVGNPLLDEVKDFRPAPNFKEEAGLTEEPVIAVLPGSRKQEVILILEVMLSIIPHFPNHQFVVAGVNNLARELYSSVEALEQVKIVFNKTYDLLSVAEAAVVTSGTASLETALLNVPQVVCYRTSNFTYQIARRLLKVDYISLVNLIAGEEVVKELIQDEFTTKNLENALTALLPEGKNRKKVMAGYQQVIELLGNTRASHNTAKLITEYLA